METPKRWVFVALFSFILVCFSTHLLLNRDSSSSSSSSQEAEQLSLMRDLKNTIMSIVDGASTSEQGKNNQVPLSDGHTTKTPDDHPRIILSPNLTTCHRSLSDADVPVYCCPPKRESTEPIIDFKFPNLTSSPLRIRRPAHLATEDDISKYNRAIAIMKSLPYDDPRSYLRQANMHCIYCTGAYNQQHTNSLFKIHRSWMFYPWHRMMIYFHERILGSLINDDTFALPFWNWDTPEGMMIPSMYMKGSFVDTQREVTHLPPQVADINFDYVERGLGPEEQISTNVAFMYNQMVSGAKKTELFMGCSYKAGEEGFCDGPGTIELAPHNSLHTWVGNTENPERENFGAFYSAARDPIFYAHHANIDRLWEVWRGLRSENFEITDPDYLDTFFFFHDENSQLVRVSIRDFLDKTKLGYTYENVENPWLNARPKPSVPPKIARHVLRMKENDEKKNSLLKSSTSLTSHFGPEGRTLDSTIRMKVHRPKTHRTKEEKEKEEEILVVYGIEIKKDKYVKFDVYINAVDETIIGPESREFAGTFVNMKRGVKLVMNKDDVVVKRKTKLKLGISEVIEDLEADGDESIWVTLVPRGGTGVNTTVEGVRIEYMR